MSTRKKKKKAFDPATIRYLQLEDPSQLRMDARTVLMNAFHVGKDNVSALLANVKDDLTKISHRPIENGAMRSFDYWLIADRGQLEAFSKGVHADLGYDSAEEIVRLLEAYLTGPRMAHAQMQAAQTQAVVLPAPPLALQLQQHQDLIQQLQLQQQQQGRRLDLVTQAAVNVFERIENLERSRYAFWSLCEKLNGLPPLQRDEIAAHVPDETRTLARLGFEAELNELRINGIPEPFEEDFSLERQNMKKKNKVDILGEDMDDDKYDMAKEKFAEKVITEEFLDGKTCFGATDSARNPKSLKEILLEEGVLSSEVIDSVLSGDTLPDVPEELFMKAQRRLDKYRASCTKHHK